MGASDPKVSEIVNRLPLHGFFLEVGLLVANFPRLIALKKKSIHFWGMDNMEVCTSIWATLPEELKPGITLIGNETYDYNWNLLMLIKSLEERTGHSGHFDAVYLDGHHTLFVDGLAMFLCSALIKPKGYLIMDDYDFTLNQQELGIRSSSFFNKQYDFDSYSKEQRSTSHLKLVIDHLLKRAGNFNTVIENFAWQKLC